MNEHVKMRPYPMLTDSNISAFGPAHAAFLPKSIQSQ